MGKINSRAAFHEACNLANVWVYGEGFTEEQLDSVRELDFVKDVQLRMSVNGSTPDFDGAQTDIYLERENIVNTPYFIEGEEFDSSDTDGVWLANAFAKARNITVGDDFRISYNGIVFTRQVKGLIESSEYEYRQAETDSDVDVGNIAIADMSYDAFPIRDYVNHMVEQGKITVDLIQKETNLLDSYIEQLEAKGMSISDITQENIKQRCGL